MKAPATTSTTSAPADNTPWLPLDSPIEAAPRKDAGWRTAPFLLTTMAGLILGGVGGLSNLIVLLIREFNVTSINAAQINNIISGCTSFFPLVAAVLADSFLGCFTVIWSFALLTFMGLVLLLISTTASGLRPPSCAIGSLFCVTPTTIQYAVLYAALGIVAIGAGGTRFTLTTMGANQFTKLSDQSTFFNIYFFIFYLSGVSSMTLFIYIEDNIGWGLAIGIAIGANVIGLAAFFMGKRHYSLDKPKGSPFTSLLRVIVASFRKRKLEISYQSVDNYYYGGKGVKKPKLPTKSWRILNRAAMKTEGDLLPDGSTVKDQWKLCSVEQVEDLKSLIKILPLWSSSIFLSTSLGIQMSLTVLQALKTNLHLAHHFQLPPASILVFMLLSTTISLALLDYALWPLWRKLAAGKIPTALQQIGVGHILTIGSMGISTMVESRRQRWGSEVVMPVLWLVPQLAVSGIGEAFHFPGQVSLYYQEFPTCLKTMATAMISMLIGIGFYLSTAVIDFVRRVTKWLPDNIDDGRLDNVYLVLVVMGALNFLYFLACCWTYEYKNNNNNNVDSEEDQQNV